MYELSHESRLKFEAETKEDLEAFNKNLLLLKNHPEDKEFLNKAFQAIQTINEIASFFKIEKIALLTRNMQAMLAEIQAGKTIVVPAFIEIQLSANDVLISLIRDFVKGGNADLDISTIIARLNGDTSENANNDVDKKEESEIIEDEFETANNEDNNEEIIKDFIIETEENLQLIENSLLLLEKDPADMEALNEAFRSIHTIKGLANYLGMVEIASLTHLMETKLDDVRSGKAVVDLALIEVQLSAKDVLISLVRALDNNDKTSIDISTILLRLGVELSEGIYNEDVNKDAIDNKESAQKLASKTENNLEANDNAVNKQSNEIVENGFETATTESLANDDENNEEIINDFVAETEDNLQLIENSLLSLENEPGNMEAVNEAFRSIHTIKGLANYLGIENIARLTHLMETKLDDVRSGKTVVDLKLIEVQLSAKDLLASLVRALVTDDKTDVDISNILLQLGEEPPGKTFNKNLIDGNIDNNETVPIEKEIDDEINHGFASKKDENLVEEGDNADKEPSNQIEKPDEKVSKIISNNNSTQEGQTIIEEVDDSIEKEEVANNFLEIEATNNLEDSFDNETFVPHEKDTFSVPSDVNNLDSLYDLDLSDGMSVELLTIPGVGKVKTKALHDAGFKTVGDIRQATKEELTKVKGINELTAELIIAEVTAFISLDNTVTEPDLFLKTDETKTAVLLKKPEEPPCKEKTTEIDERLCKESLLPVDKIDLKSAWSLPESSYSPAPQFENDNNTNTEKLTDHELEKKKPNESVQQPDEKKVAEKEAKADNPEIVSSMSEASAKTLRVDIHKIDSLIASVGELVVNRSAFTQISNRFREAERLLNDSGHIEKRELRFLKESRMKLEQTVLGFGRVLNELQGDVMRVRMVPIKDIFNRFPRLVRSLSLEVGKKVTIEISGGETELDKNVTDEIYNPLMHLLRNAIDHGIESTEQRNKIGKKSGGQISLSAHHEGDKVIIIIRDDGKGLDTEYIKEKAIKNKIITKTEANLWTKKEIINLIFHPGFSTAEKVSKISGRGVGMDVVKKKVDELKGTIEIESEVGKFTQFNIVIPLTLAIIQALLVKVEDEIYCVPLTSVIEAERTKDKEIETIENTEVIRLRDKVIPLLRISKIFHVNRKNEEKKKQLFVVIVTDGIKESGLVVDSLVGERSIVIKPFEESYMETPGISGATILGDGSVSLILDVPALIDYSIERIRMIRSVSQNSNIATERSLA